MSDDMLTQLQNDIAFRLRLQAKVSNLYEIRHPNMVRVPTIYEEAADEIERLRTLLNNTCERENQDNTQGEVMSTDKWREIADDLYKQVCINFCWHCGHERTRECSAEEAVTRYRDAVCDEQR